VNVVAKNIRKIRTAQPLSQEALAKKLNITRQAVSNWETGKSLPDIEMLTLIADVLSVDVTELIYGQKSVNAYERTKRKRVLLSIILMAFLVVGSLAFIRLMPVLKRRGQSSFNMLPYFFLSLTGLPFLYGLAPAAALSLLSVWKDFRIKNEKVKLSFRIAGVVFICLYLAILSMIFYAAVPVWTYEYPQVFGGIGLLLFLGFYGEEKIASRVNVILGIILLCAVILCALITINMVSGL